QPVTKSQASLHVFADIDQMQMVRPVGDARITQETTMQQALVEASVKLIAAALDEKVGGCVEVVDQSDHVDHWLAGQTRHRGGTDVVDLEARNQRRDPLALGNKRAWPRSLIFDDLNWTVTSPEAPVPSHPIQPRPPSIPRSLIRRSERRGEGH